MSSTAKFNPINYLRYLKRKLFPTTLGWTGDYAGWKEAEKFCTGYNQAEILDKVKNAALAVKESRAAYERDSVLFHTEKIDRKLVETLLSTANGDTLRVIDVGGSLGSTYYQNRKALMAKVKLDWNIIEQPHYVDCGKKYFEENSLHYYYTIQESLAVEKADVLLAACMIQYIEEPYTWMQRFLDSGVSNIILERAAFVEADKDLLTVQTVPPSIYEASYPSWFFKEENIISFFRERGFVPVHIWDDSINIPMTVNNKTVYWKSFLFKKA